MPADHFYSNLVGRFGFVDSRKKIIVWFGDNGKQELLDIIRNVDKKRVLFQLGDIDWI